MISPAMQEWIALGIVLVTAGLFVRGFFTKRRAAACSGCRSGCSTDPVQPPRPPEGTAAGTVIYGAGLARSLDRGHHGIRKDR